MTLLSNEEFLSQLGKMYMDARLGGAKSVCVTMKPYDGRTKAMPKDADPQPADGHKCLFRAKRGRQHISTVVTSKEAKENRYGSKAEAVTEEKQQGLMISMYVLQV
ncbi:unnamed protein product [Cylicocyclus nassatus]|uniref:Signal recognition particle 14 kDa protein n=1 Tax=Cylicocyclus nassatus TaxID=53992 RepID=A0AA36H537_CYLNA|nr:unnamed protein product [Cylicocyclus nassatus]